MKIYLCASFAYEDKQKTRERQLAIEGMAERIRKHIKSDTEIYLPHKIKIENAWDMSLEDWSLAVYESDLKHLQEADLVVFLSFGKENNSGSVWECGYVSGYNAGLKNKKKIIMIKMTDTPESLMLFGSIDTILSIDEVETYDWVNLPVYKTKCLKLSW